MARLNARCVRYFDAGQTAWKPWKILGKPWKILAQTHRRIIEKPLGGGKPASQAAGAENLFQRAFEKDPDAQFDSLDKTQDLFARRGHNTFERASQRTGGRC